MFLSISPEDIRKIKEEEKRLKNRERLWEDEDRREKRRAREYVARYNIENGASIKNAIAGGKNTRVRVSSTKSQWQRRCENGEKSDHIGRSSIIKYKKLCVLLQGDYGIIKNATVTRAAWGDQVYISNIGKNIDVRKWEYMEGGIYTINNIKTTSDEILAIQIKTGAAVYEII